MLLGAMFAVQPPVNALLGRTLASPVAAALISVAVSAAAAAVLLLVSGEGPRWREPPVWMLLVGGVLGILFVFGSLRLVPVLGSATFVAAAIAGQVMAGLVLDHVGAFGIPEHAVSPGRLLAASLILAGAVLLRLT